MLENTFDLISRLKFFENKNIIETEQIADNKWKIKTGKNVFVIGLYEIELFKYIEVENKIAEALIKSNVDILKIYDFGIMPDLNCSYKILDFRPEENLKEYILNHDKKDNYNLGYKFGKILYDLHNLNIDGEIVDWKNQFLTGLNLLLFNYGMIKESGVKDYLLLDHISENKRLLVNTASNLLYTNLNYKNIRVYSGDKINLRGLKTLKYGDGISDFIAINTLSILSPHFSKAVVDGYNNGKNPPRKFFRLMSFYEACFLLDQLVKIRNNKNSELGEDEIDKIINNYDNFTEFIPKWMNVDI
ncbi:MAG: kanamycin kinase [Peptoniphilaceae bacterium]|nr:kanamycin kinase [Peptoniphilaceae bacterium]